MEKLDKTNVQDILALTPMQEGMLFHYLKNPQSNYYFEQLNLDISGEIDINIFEKAWNFVIETNEMLRTVFRWENMENPVQIVLKEYKIQPRYYDCSMVKDDTKKHHIEEIKGKEKEDKLDLRQVPFRVTLCKVGKNNYVLIICNHHILYDGWSNGIILKEFLDTYDALSNQTKPVRSEKSKFKDFVRWIQHQDKKKSENHWRKYLENFESPIQLPAKINKEKKLNAKTKFQLKLAPETTNRIESFVKDRKITLPALLYSAWGILLQRYNYCEDVVFDTTVSARSLEIKGIENTVGLFINTVPFRVKTHAGQKIKNLLDQTHNMLKQREEFEIALPVTKENYLQTSRPLLFDSLLVIENYPLDGLLKTVGERKPGILSFSISEITRYDITLIITAFNIIRMDFTYAQDIFEEEEIKRLARYLAAIIRDMTGCPGKSISGINMLPEEKKGHILSGVKELEIESQRYKQPVYILDKYLKPVPPGFLGEIYTGGEAAETFDTDAIELIGDPFSPGDRIARTGNLVRRLADGRVEYYGNPGKKDPRQSKKSGKYYAAASNPVEKKLVEIWSEVLNKNRNEISVKAGLFEIGGNSLVVIRLINKIKKELQVEIGFADFLGFKTIEQIADQIIRNRLEGLAPVESARLLQGAGFPVSGTMGIRILLTMNLPYTRVFGGANKSNRCLAEEMAGRGHSIKVIAPALDTPPTRTLQELVEELTSMGTEVEEAVDRYIFTLKGVEVHAVLDAGVLRDVLIEEIKNYKPDWIFISSEDPSQLLLRAVHQVSPDNIIYLAHTPQMLPFGPQSFYPGKKRKELIGKSAVIVTISHFVSNYIKQWANFKTFVNHPPHYGKGNVGETFPLLGSFDNDYILMVNPCQVKGISIFISLAKFFPQLNFAFIPGWGTTPTNMMELLSLPNVTSLKSSADLNSFFRQVKILLMPSIWEEGFGMIVVDALLRGIPVIASDRGGIKEAKLGTDYLLPVKPITRFANELDENSFPKAIVPDQDIEPWKEALLALTSHRELYQYQSKKSREAALRFVTHLSVAPLEEYLVNLSKAKGLNKKTGQTQKIPIENLAVEQKIKLVKELLKIKETAPGIKEDEILPLTRHEYYDISYSQKMLLIVDELHEGYYGYIITIGLIIEGELNKAVFRKVLELVINRHESFRTVFIKVKGEYKQKIVYRAVSGIEEQDLRSHSNREQENIIETYTREVFTQPFVLREGPLFRVKLLQLSDRRHVFIMSMHHIVSDGWSMDVFFKDLLQLYHSWSENHPNPLPPLKIQYKDYASWQNRLLTDTLYHYSRHRNYWNEKLGGQLPVLELPLDYPRPVYKTYNGDSISFKLEKSKSGKLTSISREIGATLFMALVTVVKVLLHRYTGQEDIIVGIPTSGRKNHELENQVGFYVNMVPLRDEIKSVDRFTDIMVKIKENSLETHAYDDYPFEKLVEELLLDRDLSRSPLFDVMVDMNEAAPGIREDLQKFAQYKGLRLIPYGVDSHKTMTASSHDLAFLLSENSGGIDVNLIYNTDLFKRERVERMCGHFHRIIESAVSDPGIPVGEIELLTEKESEQLLYQFNGMDVGSGYPSDLLVHEKFENTAIKYPGKTACVRKGEMLSYEELNLRASHLSQKLRISGMIPDQIAAIIAGRSFEAVIGILGILKSGAGYLPIDPSYPRERIKYTLHESRSNWVLMGSDIDINLKKEIGIDIGRGNDIGIDEAPEVVELQLYAEKFKQVRGNINSVCNPVKRNTPGSIAYVIYTSGSTGRPKGVIVQHENVIRLFFTDSITKLFDFTEEDVWTMFHSYCFDFSVWEMYGALLYGGRLVIIPKLTSKDPLQFLEILKKERVTVLNQTPAAFYNLAHLEMQQSSKELNLKYVIFGGDALTPVQLKSWQEKYPATKLINMYGITETTVHVTYKELGKSEIETNISNIGKAIPTLSVYLLDHSRKLVPLGIVGELHVGGKGLSRGYLNNVLLTKEKFIDNPFKGGEQLYCSGDLAKWLSSGDLEYIGRLDHQVKIRGFRIELSEIETRLLSHASVKEAAAAVKSDEKGEKYICAYIVSEVELAAGELRDYLSEVLPHYMVPSYFSRIESMPLTVNGKIDRKALPEFEKGYVIDTRYISPGNEIEKRLAVIWEEVLNKKRIGIDDDFFARGGHSLKAVHLISQIHKEFNVEIGLDVFFESPTIREMAQYLETAVNTIHSPILPLEKNSYYPLSSAQKRLYFEHQMDESAVVYNMFFTCVLEGNVDKNKLESIFRNLIRRHESLRTSFLMLEENPVQRIHDEVEFEIEYYQVEIEVKVEDASFGQVLNARGEGELDHVTRSSQPAAALISSFNRPFDLSRAPLLRVGLMELAHTPIAVSGRISPAAPNIHQEESFFNRHILMVNMHHIISDGMSIEPMIRDFMALYNGQELPLMRLGYKDYAQWQDRQKQGIRIQKQAEYWKKEFQGDIPVLELPIDYCRTASQQFQGSAVNFEIGKKSIRALNALALEEGVTLYMVLLAVYTIFLSKLSGQEDIVVGTPAAGRRHTDLANIIGMFVNTIPMRNYPIGEKTYKEFLHQVRDRSLEAFENQDYQYEELVEALLVPRDITRNPLFDTMFAIQNIDTPEIEIPGLKLKPYEHPGETSRFDLSLNIAGLEGIPGLKFEYSTALFKRDTIERFITYLKKIISVVVENPDIKICDVDILGEKEKKQLLYSFNNTTVQIPANKTLDLLFEKQATNAPGKIAVSVCLDLTAVYDELASEKKRIPENLHEKLEKCCFEKNPYVFQFKQKGFLEALELFEEEDVKRLILLRTQRENYVAVNRAVLRLLDHLGGTINLKSLFGAIRDQDVEFRVYPVLIDLDTGHVSGKRERFRLNNTFTGMVLLIKALYRANLIELVDYRSSTRAEPVHLGSGKETEVRELPQEEADEAPAYPRDKTNGPVLLLGDRASTATTGLLYIASFLRRNGIEAYCQWNDLSKTTAQLKENVENLLAVIQPKVVGVSMKWFPHIARVLEICRIIKNYNPSIRVVVGGNTASYYKDRIIQHECIDYLIKGDGEVPFLEICLGDDDIPNCLYKKDGRIIETPITYIQDETNSSNIYLSHLDQVFVSKRDPYLSLYFYINTGKGCSMQCCYCGGCRNAQKQTFNRDKPFMRGVNEVRKDLMAAKKYASTFFFDFDLPAYDSMNYYRKIWEGIDFSQHFCEFYFWKLPTFELLDYVVKVFKYVYINVDLCSLSQPHREKLSALGLVKPQPTDEELFDFFDQCEKYSNVEVFINHIAGLPYFSYKDIEISRVTLEKLFKQYSCFKKMDWGRLHAQPGAPIVETCEKYDMHSYAKTYKDFLYYSRLNLEEERYPELLNYYYPYIYSLDEKLNSEISRFFVEAEKRVEENIKKERRNLNLVREISYEELNKKSSQLARVLRENGVTPGSITALCIERSPEMIIGLLAILKAGGAYLPLAPKSPQKRLAYMLKDSNAGMLLTRGHLNDTFRSIGFAGNIINITEEDLRAVDLKPLTTTSSPNSLAYVIYTSGSTGQPKGVLVEHRNVIRLVKNSNYIDFTGADKMLLTGALVFDISTFEIWASLLNGVLLFLANQDFILDGEKLGEILAENEISILHLIPQLFNQLANRHIEIFTGLKYLLVGGDIVQPRYINKVRNRYKELKILHMYGPTENTTFSTFLPVEKDYDVTIPIGKPLTNSRAFIINKNGQLQPIGFAGELWVGGDGVSRGYLNNPGLTAEKFDQNLWDYQDEEKKLTVGLAPLLIHRLYRTGDLAKWQPDGNIVFLGRIDQQVKVRGQRIELGEIESQLLKHEEIKAAVILDKKDKDGEKYLCAYIVPHPKSVSSVSLSVTGLREYLSTHLPDYMIPQRFVFIEKIPLNPNGKIDRKALADPETISFDGYTSPRNELEKALVEIWSGVLGIEAEVIGIDSDFFDLGGHSLKATVLTAKLHRAFNVKIALTELFRTPTIRGLVEYMQGLASCPDEMRFSAIEPVEEKEYYRLSSAQKRLYVLQQMQSDSTRYNISITLLLEGPTDKGKLEETFRKLIARHEILRTSVELIDEEPWQRVHNRVQFNIEYHDAEGKVQSAGCKEERHALCAAYCAAVIEDFIRPFDLFQAPLLRGGLIKIGDREHILMIDIHHIVFDGASMEIFVKEFVTLYSNRQLSSLRLRYRDYSEWQNSDGKKARIKNQGKYWLKQFKGDIPVVDLPYDYPRPAVQSIAGSHLKFELPDEQTGKLKDLSLNTGATLYMVLLAILNILISKISGQEDIVVGTPVAGRRHADLEKIMGIFVNTLVMRNYPSGDRTFRDFLEQIKERTLGAFENQEYQFEDLVEHVSVQRDTSRNPLFDVMFMVNNLETPIGDVLGVEITGLKIKPYERKSSTSIFDINLSAWEIEPNLVFILHYCTKLFKKENIERFISFYKKIIASILNNPDIKISQIEMISEKEKKQILFDFNDTEAEYPGNKTIQELFEEQVKHTTDNIVIVGETHELHQILERKSLERKGGLAPLSVPVFMCITYRELNHKSNQLAYLLRKRGVKPDTIVGIMAERSIEMIIGILGILKAGGAYLPIEPGYPGERIEYMLKDSGAKLLITTGNLDNERKKVRRFEGKKILLEEFFETPGSSSTFSFTHQHPASVSATAFSSSTSTLTCRVSPANLAYIIYTSGTTGMPKGVLIEHLNVVRLMFNNKYPFDFTSDDTWTMFHSYCFDFSVWEMYGAMLYGGRLVVIPGMVARDPEKYLEVLKKEKVTILNQTPSAFYNLVKEELKHPGPGLNIRYVIFGGEALKPIKLKKWKNRYPWTKLVNMFGITETTVHVTYKEIDQREIQSNISNIGTPIPTLRAYIMNRYLELLPIGVAGELCVGGRGIGRGYLNRPDLTKMKFTENPYIPGERLYRSGDLARMLYQGEMEYLGRIDHQVKIRGFRIELGEIENRLLRQKRIKEAVVIEKEGIDGDKYLCAYIVCNRNKLPGQTSSISRELKEYLSGSLPEYMIPARIIEIEAIPLTSSGKIDRSALPEPGIKPGEEYVAPGNKAEETLVNIWAEVLNLPKDVIGIDSNFFDLGGHSISATQMTAKINKELDVKIPLLEIFKSPYIRSLGRYINELRPSKFEIINAAEKKGYYPLSSGQRGVYGQHRKEKGRTAYNMPHAIILDFNVDLERLEQTFNKLIHRHEILRTSFEMIGAEPVQRVHRHVEFEIEYYAAKDSTFISKIIIDFLRPFELAKPPALRVGIIKTRENENILVMDMHHIIMDGLSAEIFKRDVIALYNGEPIPPLRIHYKDYILWQNRREIMEKIKEQREFWLKEFEGEIPVMNMPYDYERPGQRSYEGKIIEFVIGEELCNKLKEMSRQTGATLYMILVAAYNILLYKYTWQEDIIIGSPVTGRRHVDLENIIGMFVNMMVIRNRPRGGKTFKQFLLEVKEKVVAVLDNQDYHFEELVVELGCQGDAGRNPLFDVVFSMAVTNKESPGKEETDDSNRLKTIPYEFEFQITPFDLILGAAEKDETIEMTFSYSTALFNRSTIEMMSEHFMELLNQIATNCEIKLRDIRFSHHLITAVTAIANKDLEEFEF